MYETNQTLLGGLIECERETGKGVMNGEIMKEREGGREGCREGEAQVNEMNIHAGVHQVVYIFYKRQILHKETTCLQAGMTHTQVRRRCFHK